MVDEPGPGPTSVTRGRRTQVRPTVFGIVLAVLVAAGLVLRPPTADPSVTGLVVAGLLGALVVGVVWPVVVTRRLDVTVAASPPELIAGQLGSLEVELSGRASALALSCTGTGMTVLDIAAPGIVRLPLSVRARGVYRAVQVDIGSDAPFGIVRAQHTRVVELPTELLVGPVPIDHALAPSELRGDETIAATAGASLRGDSVRSVRPYVPGDPPHLVHWPTTARTGEVVVRELDPPAAVGLAVVVDLRDPTGSGDPERAASLAQGAVERLLATASRVVLCTAEAGGPVTAEVLTPAESRARLARAVDGIPGAVPEGWPSRVVAAGP